MTLLYCDCYSGISGDMLLGAFLDAGLPLEVLADQFKRLNLAEFHGVSAEKVQKGALAATLLSLDIHAHPEDSGHHHAHHRNLNAIRTLIEASSLSPLIQQTSLRIFQMLAEAEAKVHGSSIEEVHFHEVGAVDSILDIVGIAAGLEYFQIEAVFASALPLGTGTVATQHGLLPLPAPATMELLRMAQAPVTPSKATVELVTPTGAAVLAALAAFRQPEMKMKRIGVGAGRRDLDWPNIMRVFIGEVEEPPAHHLEIETNIDDMNPQILGQVMARLFQVGALDVYFTPVFMKKNRPATKLSVIVRKEDEEAICDLLLRETSTLGVRVKSIWRHEAGREMRTIQTRYGPVPVKLKVIDGVILHAAPEFEDCARLAEQHHIPLYAIIQEAERVAYDQLKEKAS